MYIDSNCTGCGLCIDQCNFQAISLFNGKAVIDNSLCRNCGLCCDICPVDAIKGADILIPHQTEQIDYSHREPPARMQKPAQNKLLEIFNNLRSTIAKNSEIAYGRGMNGGYRGSVRSRKNIGRRCSRASGRGSGRSGSFGGRGMGRGRNF